MNSLLLEGGAAGHLNHLYDNHSLTFGKMKKILSDAAKGKLVAVEKSDGANIYFSFKNGKATYARNKGDLLALGRNINDLINREFAGGPKIKKVYVDAFNAYEKAINQFDQRTIEKLFQNGTIFYNAEIQGPAFSNVITYDRNIITIHKTGHKQVNVETQTIEPFEDRGMDRLLDKAIDAVEQPEDGSFKLRRDAIVKLNDISSGKDLQIVKGRLDKIVQDAGLTDASTIEDYLNVKLLSYIKSALPEIAPEIQSGLALSILGKANMSKLIPKGSPKELKGRISTVKKNGKKLLSSAIWPIEEAIHDFSVEILKGLESAFIVDNNKELTRLRDELASAIKTIKSSGHEEAMEILNKQLAKIKDHKNVNTPMEGIVFQYDDQIYKFTGNFAPINQILGLFRYGRGSKIPKFAPDKERNIEGNSGRVIAAIPGGFKPPHAGHYGVAKYFANSEKVDIVYVLISPKERGGHSADNRISIDKDMSLKLWKLYTKNDPKIKPIIASSDSPVKAVYDFMNKLEPGDVYLLAQGEKETEAGDTRFDRAQQWADQNKMDITVKVINVPPIAGGISGTVMRDLIAAGNAEEFKKNLPSHLSNEEKDMAWKIVSAKQNMFEKIIKKSLVDTIKSSDSFRHLCEQNEKQKYDYAEYKQMQNQLQMTNNRISTTTSMGQRREFEADKRALEIKMSSHPWEMYLRSQEKQGENPVQEDFQDDVKRRHYKEKKEILGTGEQAAGAGYTELPSYERSKSAPPIGEKVEKQKLTDDEEEWLYEIITFFFPGKSFSSLFGRGAAVDKVLLEYPQLDKAIKKFGLESINHYLSNLDLWVSENEHYGSVIKGLIEDKEILQILNPIPKLPKWLFRGLRELEEIPNPGQSVVYTTKRPETSWTSSQKQAKEFCNSDGVVLATYAKDLMNRADLFLWPLDPNGIFKKSRIKIFIKEQEWAFRINEYVPIYGIHYCHYSLEDMDPEDKQRVKQLKRSIDENEGNKGFFEKIPVGQPNPVVLVDNEEKVNEMSGAGAGAVAGGMNPMFSRKDFVEELILREKIREAIKHVKKILKESKVDDDTPHANTGINILETLLKKIIPILEQEYKTLTTSPEQRQSFRSHIVRAIQNAINPQKSRDASDEDSEKFIPIQEQEPVDQEGEADISVDVGNDPESDEEKFIDIEDKPKQSVEDKEQAKIDQFSIEGEDSTGRNIALSAFEKIEQQILDNYSLLSDEEDRQLFYDYLLTNVKLYFDKFEDELSTTLNEPTTPQYEKEKEGGDASADTSTEPEAGGEGGGSGESLEDIDI